MATPRLDATSAYSKLDKALHHYEPADRQKVCSVLASFVDSGADLSTIRSKLMDLAMTKTHVPQDAHVATVTEPDCLFGQYLTPFPELMDGLKLLKQQVVTLGAQVGRETIAVLQQSIHNKNVVSGDLKVPLFDGIETDMKQMARTIDVMEAAMRCFPTRDRAKIISVMDRLRVTHGDWDAVDSRLRGLTYVSVQSEQDAWEMVEQELPFAAPAPTYLEDVYRTPFVKMVAALRMFLQIKGEDCQTYAAGRIRQMLNLPEPEGPMFPAFVEAGRRPAMVSFAEPGSVKDELVQAHDASLRRTRTSPLVCGDVVITTRAGKMGAIASVPHAIVIEGYEPSGPWPLGSPAVIPSSSIRSYADMKYRQTDRDTDPYLVFLHEGTPYLAVSWQKVSVPKEEANASPRLTADDF